MCASLSTPMRQRAAVPTAHPSTHVFESQRHIISSALPPRARRLRRCGRERWCSSPKERRGSHWKRFLQHEPKPHPHRRRPPARIRAGLVHSLMCPSGTAIERGPQSPPRRSMEHTPWPSPGAWCRLHTHIFPTDRSPGLSHWLRPARFDTWVGWVRTTTSSTIGGDFEGARSEDGTLSPRGLARLGLTLEHPCAHTDAAWVVRSCRSPAAAQPLLQLPPLPCGAHRALSSPIVGGMPRAVPRVAGRGS